MGKETAVGDRIRTLGALTPAYPEVLLMSGCLGGLFELNLPQKVMSKFKVHV